MILFLLAYLAGALTIVSPCILPVLPFVFARADRPFLRNGLPMLVGMAATFAAVATLAAVGGGWAVEANRLGRIAALAVLALFGATLLVPALADSMTRSLVALGGRLSEAAAPGTGRTVLPSLLLGVATGLLWAPCAGPVLGLILTGAALGGASLGTSLLLFAYAAGAATALALALLAGGRVLAAMKHSFGIVDGIRRGLGAAVLIAVGVVALGLDGGLLTRLSLAGTTSLEQGLLDRLRPPAGPATGSAVIADGPGMTMMMKAQPAADTAVDLPVEGRLPSLAGAVAWLNSPPLTAEALKGKVVLVDFWTYSCINCLRTIPHVREWAETYRDQGLVVIGVHAPEFAFEKDLGNVRKAVADLRILYPVAIDNDYAIWRAFANAYWPAHYVIDAAGRIRHHHFGEGDYDGTERVIRQLLAEAGRSGAGGEHAAVRAGDVGANGVEVAPDLGNLRSPETYIGFERAEHFVSPGGVVRDTRRAYQPGQPGLNEWGLAGDWTIGAEKAILEAPDGAIRYRFHARDLHLVLGPAAGGAPVRFRVTLDGAAPGDSHGTDVAPDGRGAVTEQRLYQLVRQAGPVLDHTFDIEFLDPGVQAYAFTFG